MQILGINNYYQPKYLNTNQRKMSNIQQLQTNPDSFTFTSRAGYLKVMGYNNLSNFQNLKHPDNRAFYEKLRKKLYEVPSLEAYYSLQNVVDEEIIKSVYDACLDACKVVNKIASQVLFNMCRIKEDAIHEIDTPEWEIREEKSKIYEEESLEGVAKLLNSAKDKNGNHNIDNLKFMLYLYKKCELNVDSKELIDIFRNLTDKNGNVVAENIKKFKSIINNTGWEWYAIKRVKEFINLDDNGIKFVDNMLQKMSQKSKKSHYKDRCEALLKNVLSYNKSKDADNVFNILNDNIDFIIKDSNDRMLQEDYGSRMPVLIKIALNKDEQISLKNLEKAIDLLKNEEYELYDILDEGQPISLKDKNGIIRDENIQAYEKIKYYIQDTQYRDEKYLTMLENQVKDFKDKNGVKNLEFADKLVDLCEKYEFNTQNGYVRNLLNIIIRIQKDDKPLDWDLVEMLCKYIKKSLNYNPKTSSSGLSKGVASVLDFIRDKKTKDILPNRLKIFKQRADIDNPNTFKSVHKIQAELETENTLREFFKNNPDYGNLYTAEDMLKLLRDMNDEEILNTPNILTTPIKEGDSPILMYLADIIPTEENAKTYDRIIKLLNDGFNFDYNYKDNMGVSFVEKVIMSENSKLLELIKDKPLEYYPELEYTYKNIQNPEFKEGVKGLNFKLSESDKEIGKSEKIEEKAKSIEEEKPLLASVLKKYSNEEV